MSYKKNEIHLYRDKNVRKVHSRSKNIQEMSFYQELEKNLCSCSYRKWGYIEVKYTES